jgi:NAD(P)H-hydrate epimerase
LIGVNRYNRAEVKPGAVTDMTIPILTVEAVRAAEKAADEAGVSYAEMMERAGAALAARLAQLLRDSGAPPEQWRVTILVGPGNNGGDGLVAGRKLAVETGASIRIYLLAERPEGDPHLQAALDAGLAVARAGDDQRFRVLAQMVTTSLIVVDALFGIGARLPLNQATRKLLKAVKTALDAGAPEPDRVQFADDPAPRRTRRARIVAVDCPSGLDCDTGALDDYALPAEETMTMIAAKPGLFLFPGAGAVGRLGVASLALPPSTLGMGKATHRLVTADDVRDWLPARRLDSHKGTHGRVLVVGGSANYTGAPAMTGLAAYRTGAGLVTVGVPEPLVDVLAGGVYEATWLPLAHEQGALIASAARLARDEAAHCDALVIGMGMGRAGETKHFLHGLLGGRRARPSIGFAERREEDTHEYQPLPPLVIDADGLALLSEIPDWPALLPEGTILTPHPGEMARLCGLSTDDVINQRWTLAAEKAADWGVTVLLKGAHTLVAAPDGTVYVLPFKSSALATAGTGDVLAGMIGALRGQQTAAPEAAAAAGYLHGLAGIYAAHRLGSERAGCASDVIAAIPDALAAVEGRPR